MTTIKIAFENITCAPRLFGSEINVYQKTRDGIFVIRDQYPLTKVLTVNVWKCWKAQDACSHHTPNHNSVFCAKLGLDAKIEHFRPPNQILRQTQPI